MQTRSIVFVLAGTIAAAILSGCLVVPGRHGKPMLLAPPLPPLVVLESEPYYAQSGYHYHYQNDNWYYARSRGGPWSQLPRDRYPREVRYNNENAGGGGRGHGRSGR